MNSLEVTLGRLAARGFQILPAGTGTHVVVERGGFASLVERTPGGLGKAGGPGLLTEHGFAALVWRGTHPFFVFKQAEQPATEDEVASLRQFASDLDDALKPQRFDAES